VLDISTIDATWSFDRDSGGREAWAKSCPIVWAFACAATLLAVLGFLLQVGFSRAYRSACNGQVSGTINRDIERRASSFPRA
jgi:hypothetical protein